MACTALTKGRGLDCNRISGGIKYIYFGVYDKVTGIDYDSVNPQILDAMDLNSEPLYRYTMPLGVASVTDTISGSRENGTIFNTPTVNIVLNRLTKEDQNEVKLLSQSKVIIFAQLNSTLANGHDEIIALGTVNGMELNAGTMDSGSDFGSRQGYTLTFDGLEPVPFKFVEDYTTTPFDNTGFTNPASPVVDPS